MQASMAEIAAAASRSLPLPTSADVEHPARSRRRRTVPCQLTTCRIALLLPIVQFLSTRRHVNVATALTHNSAPELAWRTSLTSGKIADASFRRGNGIFTPPRSPTDAHSDRAYTLLDDGTLTILRISTGSILEKYTPPSAGTGYDTTSFSGVSISADAGAAAYAVVDTPPAIPWDEAGGLNWYDHEEWFKTSKYDWPQPGPADVALMARSTGGGSTVGSGESGSRIVSVDLDGNHRWTYSVAGVVVGTPTYSSDGKLIYVLTNRDHKGRFLVLKENDDGTGVSKHHESGWDSSTKHPYGPLSLRTVSRQDGSGEDLLHWVETLGDVPGYASAGKLHRVRVELSNYVVLSESVGDEKLGSATAPHVNGDGSRVWLAGQDSRVLGRVWTDLATFTDWTENLDRSTRNSTMPLLNTAVGSSDYSYLYVPSSSTSFYCLDSKTGGEVWKVDEKRSVYLTEARVSPDDAVVYSILHMDGTVMAHDALTGNSRWQINCVDLTDNVICQDSVEAEFALSADGQYLIYGDIFGTITALTVAQPSEGGGGTGETGTPTAGGTGTPTATPTASPTAPPTTGTPTSTPTAVPSGTPSSGPSAGPSAVASDAPSAVPSGAPSASPTPEPSGAPSVTSQPTAEDATPPPTGSPTREPTNPPTGSPTLKGGNGNGNGNGNDNGNGNGNGNGGNGNGNGNVSAASGGGSMVSNMSPAAKGLMSVGLLSFGIVLVVAAVVGFRARARYLAAAEGKTVEEDPLPPLSDQTGTV